MLETLARRPVRRPTRLNYGVTMPPSGVSKPMPPLSQMSLNNMSIDQVVKNIEMSISRLDLILQDLDARMEIIEETIGLALENPLEDEDAFI